MTTARQRARFERRARAILAHLTRKSGLPPSAAQRKDAVGAAETGKRAEKKSDAQASKLKAWPSFGSVLRGCRVGFRWSEKYQCFLRITTPGDLICIEVAPDRGIPSKGAGDYRCWWDAPDVLDQCPALDGIGKVTTYRRMYVDENGKTLN